MRGLAIVAGLCSLLHAGAAGADMIGDFRAVGTFRDGSRLGGDLVVDTTLGEVLRIDLTIATLAGTFAIVQDQGSTNDYYAPSPPPYSVIMASDRAGDVTLTLDVYGPLVGFAGGDIFFGTYGYAVGGASGGADLDYNQPAYFAPAPPGVVPGPGGAVLCGTSTAIGLAAAVARQARGRKGRAARGA